MHSVIVKTFGGLSFQYYIRQFLFGCIFLVAFLWMGTSNIKSVGFLTYVFVVASTLLYPYSRFVYESVTSYIIGKNFFIVNAIVLLGVKFTTMLLCWVWAIFIAPIGLLYLYVHHSRNTPTKP